MKILHIISSVDSRGGGPIEGVIQHANFRSRTETGTTSIVSLDDPNAPWVQMCPVPVFALGRPGISRKSFFNKMPWRRYGYSPYFETWLKKHALEYDIIVINGIWNYSVFAAKRILLKLKMPYVVYTHGMLDPWFKLTYPVKHIIKQLFWIFSEGPLLNGARAVLFTTEDERFLARNAFWPYRVRERVVSYGTSDIQGEKDKQIHEFRSKLVELGDRRYLLFLSRIHPKKGCDILIEAFANVSSIDPDLDLVIAGPDQVGWQKALEARATALGIQHRIHWPGMLRGDAKWGAFRGSEGFILPSHQENFGIVVAEAMSAEKPILISNKVNIWREVIEFGAGMVCEDNVRGTCEMLEKFLALTNSEKVALGLAARKAFKAKFDIEQVGPDLQKYLESLIE